MTPLNLSPHTAPPPEDHAGLLRLLGERPGPAVIWHHHEADASRVELSGRVLQNWAVKMIGLLDDEVSPEPGDLVLVDSAPHWKSAAAVLAVSALGCRVRLVTGPDDLEDSEGEEPALVVTDAPHRWEDAEALGDAELAALSPGLRDVSYEDAVGRPIPGWVLDVSADVPQQPDQLAVPLPSTPLPECPGAPTRGSVITQTEPPPTRSSEGAPPEWTARRWTDDDVVAVMLGTWARSGRVLLWQGEWADETGQPRREWLRTAEEESVPS
ncbi:MAG: TIGR03089 family protein [Nesterenkonia sp.]|nr:TIGR03089 family protein [Nesterenkonia sp.]